MMYNTPVDFCDTSDHAALRCLVTFFIYVTVVAVRDSLYITCLQLAKSEPNSANVSLIKLGRRCLLQDWIIWRDMGLLKKKNIYL